MNSRFSRMTLFTVGLGLLAGLLIVPPALAQVPVITAVVNDAGGGSKLSPGVPVRIYFAPIESGRHSFTVTIGGRQILAGAPSGRAGYSSAVLPRDLPLGLTSLTITTSKGTSAPFVLDLDAVSPRLSPPFGDPDDPIAWSCPSRQGGFIRLNATGLGPTNPTVTEHGVMQLTVAQPSVTIGGKAATVIRSYLAVPYLGSYQVSSHPRRTPRKASNQLYLRSRAKPVTAST
jgi:uncharacterized protein (TIGR03437 family)